jgi:serine/threonine protein kinase
VENSEDWIVETQDILIEEEIGSGNSCTVYKGKWKGLKVAVKKMKLSNEKSNSFKEFIREISTLVKLKPHNNLVSLIGVG